MSVVVKKVQKERTWRDCLNDVEKEVKMLREEYKKLNIASYRSTKEDRLKFKEYAETAEKNIETHLNMLACKMRELNNNKVNGMIKDTVNGLSRQLSNYDNEIMKAIGKMMGISTLMAKKRSGKNCYHPVYGNLRY